MKALSLIQPWASLIATGAKRIETRTWPTSYRGPIAIHASKWRNDRGRIISSEIACYLQLALDEPFSSALTMGGIDRVADLPSGAIVATAHLFACRRTEDLVPDALEREFGNYAPGRWCWVLERVRPLPAPIPCRGAQGLWDVPPDVLAAVQTSAPAVPW
jgi:hypothetical protein